MLLELAVRDLGVIADLRLLFGDGMTAVTGETGAGKTLVVDAIELLVGGRADAVLVRHGAAEASVEGRFLVGDDEVVLARVVPRDGRSRADIDGRLATVGALAEVGGALVDLHGQHAHQSLLAAAVQREVLDRYAGIDLAPLDEARTRVREIERALEALGGDERARAREMDLLRFQVDELDAARIEDPDEDVTLEREEDALADAVAHQDAAAAAVAALVDEGGAADAVGGAIAAVNARSPFTDLEARLRATAAEIADIAADVRAVGESIEDDPERLATVRDRRHRLRELRRKYGDTLTEVIAEHDRLRARLAELEDHDRRAEALDADRAEALAEVARRAAVVARTRRKAAPRLAAAVQKHLVGLAMPNARTEVDVRGDDPADDVRFLLAANPGAPPLPLAKVASGGELARAMLALRLVLTAGPSVLVFDEVDAGIGGEAALAVGRSLSAVAREHQVLVVTHLPQVAAVADAQVRIAKDSDEATTVASAEMLVAERRVVELSRMLSGQPDSDAARTHARDLLTAAARERAQ